MTKRNLIEAYVDATRAIKALRVAEEQEGKTPSRSAAITKAVAEQTTILGQMNGGDLGKARLILAGQEAK